MKQRVKHIILLILAMWVAILPSVAVATVAPTHRYYLRDYSGNYIYQNGNISMIITPAGYISGSMRYYYLKDYQGNNCVVLNQNGVVQQINHYYPYGSLMGEGFNASSQPYRYGGKELVTLGGLNLSDFGARWLDSPSGTFTSMDPLCEDFQHLSPYLYCAGNPIKYIDPTGRVLETVWDLGNLLYDVGAAIYNHVIGDHESAKSHWVDAGFDGLAAATPIVPAGITKVNKITKSTTSKIGKSVHGNSKNSTNAQHAYDIIDTETNKVVKTGISGGKIRKDGKSARAESQVKKWNKEAGKNKYKSKITHKEPAGENARDKILKYEEQRAEELRNNGHLIDRTKHQRP